jgi:hypothetical protein
VLQDRKIKTHSLSVCLSVNAQFQKTGQVNAIDCRRRGRPRTRISAAILTPYSVKHYCEEARYGTFANAESSLFSVLGEREIGAECGAQLGPPPVLVRAAMASFCGLHNSYDRARFVWRPDLRPNLITNRPISRFSCEMERFRSTADCTCACVATFGEPKSKEDRISVNE